MAQTIEYDVAEAVEDKDLLSALNARGKLGWIVVHMQPSEYASLTHGHTWRIVFCRARR